MIACDGSDMLKYYLSIEDSLVPLNIKDQISLGLLMEFDLNPCARWKIELESKFLVWVLQWVEIYIGESDVH